MKILSKLLTLLVTAGLSSFSGLVIDENENSGSEDVEDSNVLDEDDRDDTYLMTEEELGGIEIKLIDGDKDGSLLMTFIFVIDTKVLNLKPFGNVAVDTSITVHLKLELLWKMMEA